MSLKKKKCTRELWYNGKNTATEGKGPLLCVMGRGRLYFLDSKITADGDWSHEIKRRLLLEEKLWPT